MSKFILFNPKIPYYQIENDPNRKWEIEADEVSDGYHTMLELYEHRYALFTALVNLLDNWITPLSLPHKCWKSKLHSDGTMYEGYFIVGITSKTWVGEEQLSYHLPMSWWDKVKCIELPQAPEWDGHTAADVIKRLERLV